MVLSRNKIFGIGVGVILLFITVNRIDFLIGSSFTKGEVISTKRGWRGHISPVIRFHTSDGWTVTFTGELNSGLATGEVVDIVYKTDSPKDVSVFSFVGFIMTPMLYALLPLLLWAAASLSFIGKNETVMLSWKGIRRNKPLDDSAEETEKALKNLLTRLKQIRSAENVRR